jgi:predicted nuclease with RNAse H fold
MLIVGIDLAGPTNVRDTALVGCRLEGTALRYAWHATDVDDAAVLAMLDERLVDSDVELTIGLDAPLSYNQGGGMRDSDRALAAILREHGLPNSVMAPTLTRMSYLTLRGVALTRAIMLWAAERERAPAIVEVHPGGAMALRGAPIDDLRRIKQSADSRQRVLDWLTAGHLVDVPSQLAETDHLIAACGCALAASGWIRGEPVWCTSTDPPLHPFDFAC